MILPPLLKKGGENALGVALGNGWYKGRFSYEKDMSSLYGKNFQLLAEIRLETEKGKEIVVSTDETWECAPSPVKESGIYDGEVYDARLETDHFGTVSCTLPCQAVKGPGIQVPLKDRLSPPLLITERIQEPRKILTPAGETVLDFGQEITGWVEFSLSGRGEQRSKTPVRRSPSGRLLLQRESSHCKSRDDLYFLRRKEMGAVSFYFLWFSICESNRNDGSRTTEFRSLCDSFRY